MPLTIYEENLIQLIPDINERLWNVEYYLDNITLDHTHANLTTLANIVSSGSGNIITSDERAKILDIDNKVDNSAFETHVLDPIHHEHLNKLILDSIDETTKNSWDDVVTAFALHVADTDIHHTHDPADIAMLQSFLTGNNAEGNYVRLGDIQICWGNFSRSINAVTAFGVALGLTDKIFPVNFSESPNILYSISSSGDFNQYLQFGLKPRADGFEYTVRNSHNGELPAQDLVIYWVAIGKYT